MTRPGIAELEREVCNCMAFAYGYGIHHADFCRVHEARRQWIARRIDAMLLADPAASPHRATRRANSSGAGGATE